MSDEALTGLLHATMPLCDTLGMRAVSSDANATIIEMDWTPERCTTSGILHGGALMALADTAGALHAFGILPEGATGTTTVESKTNMLGAVTEGTVTARSTTLHGGKTTIVVETELRCAERLVAKTTQTQLVLR